MEEETDTADDKESRNEGRTRVKSLPFSVTLHSLFSLSAAAKLGIELAHASQKLLQFLWKLKKSKYWNALRETYHCHQQET